MSLLNVRLETEHVIDYSNIVILATSLHFRACVISEAIEIELDNKKIFNEFVK